MKRFIDYSLREFLGASNFNMSKLARARLTKFLKNKKYENLVRLSKLKRKPAHYMKEVTQMVKDWDKQEDPYATEEIRRLFDGLEGSLKGSLQVSPARSEK